MLNKLFIGYVVKETSEWGYSAREHVRSGHMRINANIYVTALKVEEVGKKSKKAKKA